MAKLRIEKATGHWVVRAGGAVLGESDRALVLHEDGNDPVIYIPRDDIAMDFLEASETVTKSPQKGEARHFSIVTKSTTLRDVAWSYERPADEVAELADHLAFYPSSSVAVEQV